MSNDEIKHIVKAVLDTYRGEPTPDYIVDRVLEDIDVPHLQLGDQQ